MIFLIRTQRLPILTYGTNVWNCSEDSIRQIAVF